MAKQTRRSFIKHTSVGAAAVGAAVAVPGLAAAHAAAPHAASTLSTAQHEPLAAFVRDFATGEIALLVGTREVIVRDHELVARLVRAAR